ncbi:unnamed protein product [Phyllotreta striolata]|uniref:Uncharacterized protein n=1 Tax=Phyllotreta striolata TaxID=444603 RepID=A0A9N9TFG9_PHYSR|nr:unnamed protein product [Phyllotreta striolata]
MWPLLLLICYGSVAATPTPTAPRHTKGVQIKNNGKDRLWIEMTNEDAFSLPPGQMASVILEDTWSGRIFARSEECQFKRCETPYTTAELSFDGDGKEDTYKVSLADGYNVAMKIQPTGRSTFCRVASCRQNLRRDCPASRQIKDDDGAVVGCAATSDGRRDVCPQADQAYSCKTSDTYVVSIG